MPIRSVLRALILLLVIAPFAQRAQGARMKTVASIPLPCESSFQMISPAGDQAALQCRDHSLRLLNIRSGATLLTFESEPRISQYNYSRDGRWFAVGFADGTVEVVPASGTSDAKRWMSDTRNIDTLEFAPDSSKIVVGATDRPGQIWDLRGSPKQVATLHADFAGLLACSFSPDGKMLVTSDGDTVIRFYDTATWQIVHEYRGLTLETFAVSFTADGTQVVAGGPDHRITVLDSATGAEVQKLPKDPEVIRQIFPFGNEGQSIILYTDGDGQKSPHQSIWTLKTAKSMPLNAERPPTGGGIVRGKLWVSSPQGKVLVIWAYE